MGREEYLQAVFRESPRPDSADQTIPVHVRQSAPVKIVLHSLCNQNNQIHVQVQQRVRDKVDWNRCENFAYLGVEILKKFRRA